MSSPLLDLPVPEQVVWLKAKEDAIDGDVDLIEHVGGMDVEVGSLGLPQLDPTGDAVQGGPPPGGGSEVGGPPMMDGPNVSRAYLLKSKVKSGSGDGWDICFSLRGERHSYHRLGGASFVRIFQLAVCGPTGRYVFGNIALKCCLLSYFRVGDFRVGDPGTTSTTATRHPYAAADFDFPVRKTEMTLMSSS